MARNTKKKTHKGEEKIFIEGRKRAVTVRIEKSGMKSAQVSFGKNSTGKMIVKQFTAATTAEVIRAIEEYQAELDGKSGSNITFRNACLAYISRKVLKPTTANNYNDISNNRFKSLHDKPIMKLTALDIENSINEEADNGIAPKTLDHALSFLGAVMYDFEVPMFTPKMKKRLKAHAKRATAKNASKSRKKKKEQFRKYAPTAQQIAQWAGENTKPTATRTAISILLDLHSLRSEETRGLQYREVFRDPDGKCYIHICRTRTVVRSKDVCQESTKTEDSERIILIDPRLYTMIHAQPHKSEDEYIINVCYSVYAHDIKEVIRPHEINGHLLDWVSPHDLRAVFISTHKDCRAAKDIGGWVPKNADTAEKDYMYSAQPEMDTLMTEYSKSLLDAYYGTPDDNSNDPEPTGKPKADTATAEKALQFTITMNAEKVG